MKRKNMVRLTVRIRHDLFEKLWKLAAKEKMTPNKLLAKIVADDVEKNY